MVTLTNARKKLLKSLDTSKGRRQSGLFIAQGAKCVLDTLPHFKAEAIYALEDWACAHPEVKAKIVNRSDMKDISTLVTAPDVVAVYSIPNLEMQEPEPTQLYLALDRVQDPGNLGTIIRVADWMGVRTIYASADTVDVWSPKVVQATMGAIARVRVCYLDDLASFLKKSGLPVYATSLDGDNIYTVPPSLLCHNSNGQRRFRHKPRDIRGCHMRIIYSILSPRRTDIRIAQRGYCHGYYTI